ncbi:MAG: polysaccharide export protein [Acidobacteria bacterium]|nr:polysaccharide export protein [Acidobacteriota bacterium]
MKTCHKLPFVLGSLLMAGIVFAAAAPVDLERSPSPSFALRNPRYRVEASDVLELNFRFTPEFNQTVTVQPDGFVSLQSAEDLKIAGLTLADIKAALIRQYSSILHDPIVTVILKEFSKPYFLVGGEVSRPGRFDLRGDTTVTDAITIAGGFTPNAKSGDVLLFRRAGGEVVEVRKINVKAAIEKGHLQEDIRLQPGDSVYVSQSFTGKLERFMNVTKLGMYFNPVPRF